MSTPFHCLQGHRWEHLPGPSPSGGTEVLCPVCGAPSVRAAEPDRKPPTDGSSGETTLNVPGGTPPTSGDPSPTLPHESLGPASAGVAPTLPGPAQAFPAFAGYEVLGFLGRGGMGVVYKARQVGLNRLVALKMLPDVHCADPSSLARFRIEGEAVARLQHPNIVQIHEVGQHEQRPFFSMEFLEGGSLAGRLARGPVPVREAAALLEVLARAVHFAHQRGVLHRDLKPANVLLTPDGVPKLSDFGLAKRLSGPGLTTVTELTSTGEVLGTPSYMAPEQAAGRTRDASPATDVYALGAILYELLTRRPPFRGESPMDTMLRVLQEEPTPPAEIEPRVPCDLQTVCLTCLHKDPARRYASAEALADDLRAFLTGAAVRARPVGRRERLLLAARRRPLAAALTGAGAVALLGLLVGAWFYNALAVSVVAVLSLLGGAWWYGARLKTALRRLEQQHTVAERGLERLYLLLETTRRLMTAAGLDELLLLLTETTARMADAERATIFLLDESRNELWSKVALGDGVGEIRVPVGTGIAGAVALTGDVINLADPYADPRFNPEIDRRTGYRTHNLLSLPMRAHCGEILGVFQVLNKRGGAFTPEDVDLLSSLAVSAAVAVERAGGAGATPP